MGYVYELLDAEQSAITGAIDTVQFFADLPPASDHYQELWGVEQQTGTLFWPPTYKPAGVYLSDGTTWIKQPVPDKATQAEVDAGLNTVKFVTSETFQGASRWNTKEQLLTAGTNITIDRTNPAAPIISSTGGGAGEVIVLSTVDPTPTDDINASRFVGQRWINTTELRSYMAQDVTPGAAVWKEITPVGGISTGPGGEIIIDSGVSLGTAITEDLNANTNDLTVADIETAIVLRINATGNYSLTGLSPYDNSSAWMLFVANVGAGNITLKNNDAGSLAENRFLIGGNKTIQSDEGILLFYDPVSNRWRGSGILI